MKEPYTFDRVVSQILWITLPYFIRNQQESYTDNITVSFILTVITLYMYYFIYLQGWHDGLYYLLAKGANCSIADNCGRLPLHAATYFSNE